jgi:hypothetical protein
MIREFLRASFIVGWTVWVYGVAVPALVSAASTASVVGGIGLAIFGALPGIAYGRKLYKMSQGKKALKEQEAEVKQIERELEREIQMEQQKRLYVRE